MGSRGEYGNIIWQAQRLWARIWRETLVMPPHGVEVSNQTNLSRIGARVNNAGIVRIWEVHPSESTWWQECIGGICFTYKCEAASVQSALGFDNIEPTRNFQMHLLADRFGFFFFWKKELNDKGRCCALNPVHGVPLPNISYIVITMQRAREWTLGRPLSHVWPRRVHDVKYNNVLCLNSTRVKE
jgi:hypothetical protein